MYRFMLQEKVEDYDLSSVEHWATAGEALNPEVFNRWEELTGKKIASGFGQTEGTVLIANFQWFESKPGTLGKPSPIYDLHLFDADGKDCENGEEGEIVSAEGFGPGGDLDLDGQPVDHLGAFAAGEGGELGHREIAFAEQAHDFRADRADADHADVVFFHVTILSILEVRPRGR